MSAEDDITDAMTRHQIFVLRYARGREKEAEKFIAKTLDNAIKRLQVDITEFQRARLQDQIKDLYAYLLAAHSEYAEGFKSQMTDFMQYETAYASNTMGTALKIEMTAPAPTQVQQSIFANVMQLEPNKGYTIADALSEFGRKNADKVTTLVREGVLLGKSTGEIVADIKSIKPTESRKAATLARTITNHISNQARAITVVENDDVLDGYKWVATLDGRTSMICMARDGVVYKDVAGSPIPPAHFNCRSTISPVVNPEFDLGRDIEGTRPSASGEVSAETNYSKWLKRQSADFQDEVLGPTRGKLFRDGKVALDKFIDEQGNTYSLAELVERDSSLSGIINPPA